MTSPSGWHATSPPATLTLPCTSPLGDLSGAYRYIPVDTPQHAAFPAYHDGRVQWYYMPGHPFGAVGAVVSFNRFSDAVAVITRSLFAAPTEHYFDDFIQPDLRVGDSMATAQPPTPSRLS